VLPPIIVEVPAFNVALVPLIVQKLAALKVSVEAFRFIVLVVVPVDAKLDAVTAYPPVSKVPAVCTMLTEA